MALIIYRDVNNYNKVFVAVETGLCLYCGEGGIHLAQVVNDVGWAKRFPAFMLGTPDLWIPPNTLS